MINAVFGKTIENVRKCKDITIERRRNYLVSEPNYYATKCFTKNISNRNKL